MATIFLGGVGTFVQFYRGHYGEQLSEIILNSGPVVQEERSFKEKF